ncbi:hypothetical protein [Christiangramia sabulilitoris]|uniref:hypothetical protein n=1 Tax=Christiangramia sabulilitoris TaxID=2583991 RepID=UPI00140E5377|nr:hypothetical protein [Christiangramia sabulilitoris]
MKKTCVFTHGGITLDLSRIKSLHIDTWSPNKKSHILRIELDTHYEYIKNPDNDE